MSDVNSPSFTLFLIVITCASTVYSCHLRALDSPIEVSFLSASKEGLFYFMEVNIWTWGLGESRDGEFAFYPIIKLLLCRHYNIQNLTHDVRHSHIQPFG